MIYQLEHRQIIPTSLKQVWEFFATPRNLNQITPPDLEFEILFGGDQPMYQGQMMAYRIQVFPFLRTPWLTEITTVREPHFFVDQQRQGPYKFWHHQHRFTEVEGGIEMQDLVTYQLPLGPLRGLAHTMWVAPRLESIFNYRARKIIEIFGD